MAIVVYRIEDTGHLNRLEARLRRRVGGFCRWWRWIKVGITTNPKLRAKQHFVKDPEWCELVVLWKTSSRKRAQDAESMLIDSNWGRANLDNQRGGGGGRNAEGTHYLYVLLA